MTRQPLIAPWAGIEPTIADTAFIAPNATVIGDVTMDAESGAYFSSVLRGDRAPIAIGAGSNLQDNVTVHSEIGTPVRIGRGVSVGHNAVIHGCVVEDDCLIGMGARILNGAVIGAGSLVAAGAVVLEGTVVPPGSLVAGVPAKVRRELAHDERAGLVRNAEIYRKLTATYRTYTW